MINEPVIWILLVWNLINTVLGVVLYAAAKKSVDKILGMIGGAADRVAKMESEVRELSEKYESIPEEVRNTAENEVRQMEKRWEDGINSMLNFNPFGNNE